MKVGPAEAQSTTKQSDAFTIDDTIEAAEVSTLVYVYDTVYMISTWSYYYNMIVCVCSYVLRTLDY